MRMAFLPVLALVTAASAATFAGFSIKPNGAQKLNLQTGITVLEKGGVATDAERGVTIDARYIEFKDGEWLRARNAKLGTREGGTLTGNKVAYDAKTGILTVSGDLKYNDARVKDLTASEVRIDTNAKLAVATGGVRSASPGMSANIVVVDDANDRALMYGNYRYAYGSTKLSSSKPDALLLVTWDEKGKPSVSTKPAESLIAPYRAHLK